MAISVNVYCTVLELPPLAFPHVEKSRRDLRDPALAPHLDGLVDAIVNQGEMTQTRYGVMRHIQRVQHQLSLHVEEKDFDGFAKWALKANAIYFLADGAVRAPAGSVLVGLASGASDADARLPYPPDAVARKEATEKKLKKLGVRRCASLPPVIGETEVVLRPAADVARRALALFTMALRGESLADAECGIPAGELRERFPLSFGAMSPKEIAFLNSSDPGQQEIMDAVWGYECLYTLLWAIGFASELALPTRVCDVPMIAKVMLREDQAEVIKNAALRPSSELLDALDLHLRLHWAIHQAELEKQNPPKNLECGVVYERHRTLNWLVRFENAEWDDVNTPT